MTVTAKAKRHNIEVEDALLCRLIVAREASLDSAIDMIGQVAAVKRRRARRVLIVSDASDLSDSAQSTSGKNVFEDDEFIKAVSKNAQRLTKLICVGSCTQSIAQLEKRVGIPVTFIDSQEALTAELEKLSTQAAIVGAAYRLDSRIPVVLDSIFGTTFLPESPSLLDKIAVPYRANMGSTIMISGRGMVLLRGVTSRAGLLNLEDDVHGIPLVALGRFSLRDLYFTSAVLPHSVQSIGRGAFFECAKLQSVELSSSLDFVGRSAFEGCESLEFLVIPSGCRSISRYAFRNCSSLKTVDLPRSLSSIGYAAFVGCSEDLIFRVEENSYAHSWVVKNGYGHTIINSEVVSKSKNPSMGNFKHKGYHFKMLTNGNLEVNGLVKGLLTRKMTGLEIPSEVKGYKVVCVSTQAFAGNEDITKVKLPEGLHWVAPEAFAGCSALTEVSFPQTIKSIGSRAFAGCPGVKDDFDDYSVSFNDGEVTIERYHGSAEEVEIPSQVIGLPVKGMASLCFSDKDFLRSVKLPNSLQKIANQAFVRCPNLGELRIPASVTSIGNEAIESTASLVVRKGSNAHIWAIANGNSTSFDEMASGDDMLFASPEHSQLPFFARGSFTIEKFCELIGVEVPAKLVEKKDMVLPGANAYWAIARRFEAYFELMDEDEAIEGALAKQPSLLVLDKPFDGDTGEVPTIIHHDPVGAFRDVCKWRLETFRDLKIIAISGSQGKTTVKDFLATVLGGAQPTLTSAGNTNTLRSLDHALRRLKPEHRFYVQELGAGGYSGRHIQYAAAALRPHFAVLTNIRDNHLEVFGTQEKILEVKSSLVDELRDGGIALLNADDEMLWNYETDKEVVYFGVQNEQADYRAENIKTHDGYISFVIVNRGRRIPARINILGEHNVYNALIAFAIAEISGIKRADITRHLKKVQAKGIRQNYTNIAGYRMYLDCNNSSPDSIRQGIEIITKIPIPSDSRKIVVLGDINELGDEAIAKHRALADVLEQHKTDIDMFFCYGSLMTHAAEAARERGVKLFSTEDRDELLSELRDYIQEGDLIYWKASHGIRLFLTIDELVGTNFDISDPGVIDDFGKRVETEVAKFTLLPYGAQIDAWLSDDLDVVLPSHIEGKPIIALKRNSFVSAIDLRSIHFPSTVKTIGFGVFAWCTHLSELHLSEGLKLIDRSAFLRCKSLQEVTIPISCTHIGARAFFGCTSLRRVVIPPSVLTIGEQAFDECPEVKIVCAPGSHAEEYAIRNSLNYSFDSNESEEL